MKEFMLLFRMAPSNQAPSQEQVATMHQQWQQFIGPIAAAGKLVNISRLAFDGCIVSQNGLEFNQMVQENNLALSGNMTIKAKDIEDAAIVAKLCPVLFAGGTVEIRSIMPMN